MKWGIIISAAIVLIFVVAVLVGTMGGADRPTSRTSVSKLQAATLPDDLPLVYTPKNPTGDANAAYKKAFDFFLANKEKLAVSEGIDPDKKLVLELTDLMITAMNAGKVTQPFLDGQVVMKMNDVAEYEDSLEWTPELSMYGADLLAKQKKDDKALDAARAAFALGHRTFTHSVLLYNRQQGLNIMKLAGNRIWEMTSEESPARKAVAAFGGPVEKIEKSWNNKFEVIMSTSPHIGDLLNIARNDKDLTFRVQAIRWLGVAKFNPKSQGNLDAIHADIAKFKTSDQALIKRAAEVADAFSKEDLRRMR